MIDRVMAKGYKRKWYYRGSRDKYSVEQRYCQCDVPATGDAQVTMVPGATIEGMRKVKHLTVTLSGPQDTSVLWAIVYNPAGTVPSSLGIPGAPNSSVNVYNPNQFVMSSGIINFSAGPARLHSPLSRNLSSGDSVYLLMKSLEGSAASVWVELKYAITLQ